MNARAVEIQESLTRQAADDAEELEMWELIEWQARERIRVLRELVGTQPKRGGVGLKLFWIAMTALAIALGMGSFS